MFKPEIESLRGYAAFSVLVAHTFILTPAIAEYAPFVRLFFNEDAAVLLFFLISGHVLGLQMDSLEGGRARQYLAFLVRRGFRIVPPAWVAIIISYLILLAVDSPLATRSNVIRAMLFLSVDINRPLWTIFVELGAALFFPAMYWLSRRGALVNLALLAGPLWLLLTNHHWLQYLIYFHAGLLLERVGRPLVCALGPRTLRFCIAGAFVIYGCTAVIAKASQWNATTWLAAQGAAAFFLLACVVYLGAFRRALMTRPMRALGRVSFSIYLIHYPLVALAGVWTIPLGLAAAFPLHRYVERPSNELGRFVYAFFSRPRAVPAEIAERKVA